MAETKTALIVIDAQQEYFAPTGKVVLPGGPVIHVVHDTTTRQAAHLGFQVTVLSDATAAMAVKGPDGETIPADQVHKTHLGSLSGFLAEVKSVKDVAK